jgi:3',5'-cyclic AMP phosphodiesterase CpdA
MIARKAFLVVGLLASSACGRDLQRLKILVDKDAPAASGSIVSKARSYRSLAESCDGLNQSQVGTAVSLYPELTAALHPGAFARIAHVTDVQVREERALLLGHTETGLIETASQTLTSLEGVRRDPLQETNSPYVWLATVLTINEIHKQFPIDLAIHTGDASDVGLRSELQRFLYVAHKLDVPFLNVIGNHDMLCLGLWTATNPFDALYLNSVDLTAEIAPKFRANMDMLVQDRARHIRLVGEEVASLGEHAPTKQAFGSSRLGYDLAPNVDDGYYTAVVRAPASGLPGLQLIVLRTNRDNGGADSEIDDAQLSWLNDTLDSASARSSLVVIGAHHPLMEVHRNQNGLGDATDTTVTEPLKKLREMLLHYPNVVLYLTGHTHLPSIVELNDDAGTLQMVQIDSGSLLAFPQEGSMVELQLDPGATQLTVTAQKFGPMLAGGSELASRVVEGLSASARDEMSKPQYSVWRSYSGTRPLPSFPVTVPRY